jgi:carotenoid cleavage dioxygenase-like enzyme
LAGHVFILAPVGHVDSARNDDLHVFPSQDGTPLFNGNGMIYRLDFQQSGKVELKAKLAKTPCYYADDATKPGTQYAKYRFRNYGLARLSPWLGVRDVANTALLPMKFGDENERLLVTCDVGRPYEIDTQSLDLVTPVGWNREWNEQLPLNLPFPMVMNTAHPCFDARTDEMFTVNFGKSLPTLLSRLLKSDSARISQFMQEILEELSKLLEAPVDLKRLDIAPEIHKILASLELEIAGISDLFHRFWQGLRELLTANARNVGEIVDELKQLVNVARQVLVGASKIDDFLYVMRWDGRGDLERWQVELPDGSAVKIQQTMHQIGITQDYLVLMETGFKVGPEQLLTKPVLKNKKLEQLIRDLLDYPEALDTRLYIVRRADLTADRRSVQAKQVVIPESQNRIVLHVAHSNAWDVAEWLRTYDTSPAADLNLAQHPVGMVSDPVDIHSLGRYVIDGEKGELDWAESKVISDRELTWAIAIAAYNDRTTSPKFDNIYWNSWGCWANLLSEFVAELYQHYPRQLSLAEVLEIAKQGKPASLYRLVTESQAAMTIADSYQFPSGCFGNSAQFVPRVGGDGSSTDGYITCTVLSGNKSEIWIFDAQNLTKGVLCKLSHPQLKFGFTTHTTWLPQIAPRTASYYIPVREDFADLVIQQSQEMQQLFEEAVYSKFPHPSQLVGYPSIPASVMTAKRRELTDIKLDILESKLPGNKLPDGLHGHVFIVNAEGSVDSGGLPYANGDTIFNGDGTIYRLDFDREGEVRLKSRLAKTPCYYADLATHAKAKYAKYRFRNLGLSRFSIALGIRNQLNTAFVPMQFSPAEPERLLVTYDAGRPYEIDPETLEVVTPIGKNIEWCPEIALSFPFPPVLSTAHPVFDAYTREFFTVNYGRSLFSFLETIPLIYNLDELFPGVDWILAAVTHFVKGTYQLFSPVAERLCEFYRNSISSTRLKDFVYLIRWDGVGELERWKLVLPDRTPVKITQSLHQIGCTCDYIVLMDTDFKMGMDQVVNNPFPNHKELERLFRNLLTRPVSPNSTVYIVRRADLKAGQRPASSQQEVEVVARKLVIPLAAIHFLIDYENPHNQITLHVAHNCAADVSEWLRQYDTSAANPQNVPSNLCGMVPDETDISRLGRYTIDGESGRLLESKVFYDAKRTWGIGFYTYRDRLSTGLPPRQLDNIYWQSFGFWQDLLPKFIFDLYKNYQYRVVSPEELLQIPDNGRGRPPCLFRIDTNKMAIADCYEFPLVSPDGKHWDSHTLSSPQFIPRANGDGSSTDGYIMCTVFTQHGDQIWIFDAKDLAQGPLCQLGHPELNFGFTLHTAWLPKITSRTASYNCSVREDYQELVNKQSSDIQELFNTKVYPYFEANSNCEASNVPPLPKGG